MRQDTSKLLDAFISITKGASVRSVLTEGTLGLDDLKYIADKVGFFEANSARPDDDEIAFRDNLIEFINASLDHAEAVNLTNDVPRTIDAITSATRREDGSGRNETGFTADLKEKTHYRLPDKYNHFISPSEHGKRLSFDEPEDIASIVSILGKLRQKAMADPDLFISTPEGDKRASGLVFYGYKPGNNKYTVYSDPLLGNYILRETDQYPMKPDEKQLQQAGLMSVVEFCSKCLNIRRGKENTLQILKVVQDIYSNPDEARKFGSDISLYAKFYRVQSHGVVLFLTKDMEKYLMMKMGLAPLIPNEVKNDPQIRSLPSALGHMHLATSKNSREDLAEILFKLLAKDPERIISAKTGRKIKDAVFRYRSGRHTAIFIHDDIHEFLLSGWFHPDPPPEEKDKWYTGQKLCQKISVYAEEPYWNQYNTRAAKYLLEEIRNTRGDEILEIGQKSIRIGDFIKRLKAGSLGYAFYIHEALIDAKVITAEMIAEKAKIIEKQQYEEEGPQGFKGIEKRKKGDKSNKNVRDD